MILTEAKTVNDDQGLLPHLTENPFAQPTLSFRAVDFEPDPLTGLPAR
jgi:hypothetical protein